MFEVEAILEFKLMRELGKQVNEPICYSKSKTKLGKQVNEPTSEKTMPMVQRELQC